MVNKMDVGYVEKDNYGSTSIVVYSKITANNRGGLAMKLIERWGLITGINEGEDSAGRTKIEAESADDLIRRAFECADKTFSELEKRGWLLDLPAPKARENKQVSSSAPERI